QEDVTAHGTATKVRVDGIPPGEGRSAARAPAERCLEKTEPAITTVVGKDGSTIVCTIESVRFQRVDGNSSAIAVDAQMPVGTRKRRPVLARASVLGPAVGEAIVEGAPSPDVDRREEIRGDPLV